MADLSQPNNPFYSGDEHLSRLLADEVEEPWYRSFFRNIKETFNPPKLPPLEVTSKPVAVKDIWGLYGRQKKSFMMSTGFQIGVVVVLFTVFSSKIVQQQVKQMTTLQTPESIRTGFTEGNGWGFGWCVVRKPQGVSEKLSPGSFGHGGAYGTQAWIDPKKGRAYILMTQRANFPNSDDSPVRKAFQEAAAAALGD